MGRYAYTCRRALFDTYWGITELGVDTLHRGLTFMANLTRSIHGSTEVVAT